MLHAWFGKAHHNNGLINNEDLSGLSGDIPTEDGGNKWQILHQGALVELYARLAVWEKTELIFSSAGIWKISAGKLYILRQVVYYYS